MPATEQRPLTPDQRRACALLGQGRLYKEVSEELGISGKSLQRLAKRDDARALIRRTREQLVAETPSAESVLVQALGATRSDGTPSWPDRIAAAKALLSTPVTSPEGEAAAHEAVREVRIYLPGPEDANGDTSGDDESARPDPRTAVTHPTRVPELAADAFEPERGPA